MGYRVFVLKVSELEETFYYVCSRAGRDLGNGFTKNVHEEVREREPTPQLDRFPDRGFHRTASAKKVRKIGSRLQRLCSTEVGGGRY